MRVLEYGNNRCMKVEMGKNVVEVFLLMGTIVDFLSTIDIKDKEREKERKELEIFVRDKLKERQELEKWLLARFFDLEKSEVVPCGTYALVKNNLGYIGENFILTVYEEGKEKSYTMTESLDNLKTVLISQGLDSYFVLGLIWELESELEEKLN